MSADASRLLTRLDDPPLHAEPLTEEHREPLRAACADDEGFWVLYPRSFGAEHFDASFDEIVGASGRYTLALFAGGVLIGMSAYLHVGAPNRALEIGGTYLTRSARGTGVNARYKRLMIEHAFACGFQRIEFRIDVRNSRSMAAVEKLGAVKEGVLRRLSMTWTGHVRDVAVYSILAEEWAGRPV